LTVTGSQLKRMITYLFRPEALDGGHTEFYQFSSGVRVVVSMSEKRVTELSFEGKPIEDDRLFRIGLQSYHYKNMQDFFGVSEEECARITEENARRVFGL
jgi:5'-nucleotidase